MSKEMPIIKLGLSKLFTFKIMFIKNGLALRLQKEADEKKTKSEEH